MFILTISLVFSVSYSVPKRKKKYKNNEDRSQAKGKALKTGKLRYQHVNIHVVTDVYGYEGLLGSLIFRPSSYFAEDILVSSCY